MKIILAGGSGQVGTMLARAFHRDGHRVIVLSRQAGAAEWAVVPWDGCSLFIENIKTMNAGAIPPFSS